MTTSCCWVSPAASFSQNTRVLTRRYIPSPVLTGSRQRQSRSAVSTTSALPAPASGTTVGAPASLSKEGSAIGIDSSHEAYDCRKGWIVHRHYRQDILCHVMGEQHKKKLWTFPACALAQPNLEQRKGNVMEEKHDAKPRPVMSSPQARGEQRHAPLDYIWPEHGRV
jgi:hypothetical protein